MKQLAIALAVTSMMVGSAFGAGIQKPVQAPALQKPFQKAVKAVQKPHQKSVHQKGPHQKGIAQKAPHQKPFQKPTQKPVQK